MINGNYHDTTPRSHIFVTAHIQTNSKQNTKQLSNMANGRLHKNGHRVRITCFVVVLCVLLV